jgi:hypothetical protein
VEEDRGIKVRETKGKIDKRGRSKQLMRRRRKVGKVKKREDREEKKQNKRR